MFVLPEKARCCDICLFTRSSVCHACPTHGAELSCHCLAESFRGAHQSRASSIALGVIGAEAADSSSRVPAVSNHARNSFANDKHGSQAMASLQSCAACMPNDTISYLLAAACNLSFADVGHAQDVADGRASARVQHAAPSVRHPERAAREELNT